MGKGRAKVEFCLTVERAINIPKNLEGDNLHVEWKRGRRISNQGQTKPVKVDRELTAEWNEAISFTSTMACERPNGQDEFEFETKHLSFSLKQASKHGKKAHTVGSARINMADFAQNSTDTVKVLALEGKKHNHAALSVHITAKWLKFNGKRLKVSTVALNERQDSPATLAVSTAAVDTMCVGGVDFELHHVDQISEANTTAGNLSDDNNDDEDIFLAHDEASTDEHHLSHMTPPLPPTSPGRGSLSGTQPLPPVIRISTSTRLSSTSNNLTSSPKKKEKEKKKGKGSRLPSGGGGSEEHAKSEEDVDKLRKETEEHIRERRKRRKSGGILGRATSGLLGKHPHKRTSPRRGNSMGHVQDGDLEFVPVAELAKRGSDTAVVEGTEKPEIDSAVVESHNDANGTLEAGTVVPEGGVTVAQSGGGTGGSGGDEDRDPLPGARSHTPVVEKEREETDKHECAANDNEDKGHGRRKKSGNVFSRTKSKLLRSVVHPSGHHQHDGKHQTEVDHHSGVVVTVPEHEHAEPQEAEHAVASSGEGSDDGDDDGGRPVVDVELLEKDVTLSNSTNGSDDVEYEEQQQEQEGVDEETEVKITETSGALFESEAGQGDAFPGVRPHTPVVDLREDTQSPGTEDDKSHDQHKPRRSSILTKLRHSLGPHHHHDHGNDANAMICTDDGAPRTRDIEQDTVLELANAHKQVQELLAAKTRLEDELLDLQSQHERQQQQTSEELAGLLKETEESRRHLEEMWTERVTVLERTISEVKAERKHSSKKHKSRVKDLQRQLAEQQRTVAQLQEQQKQQDQRSTSVEVTGRRAGSDNVNRTWGDDNEFSLAPRYTGRAPCPPRSAQFCDQTAAEARKQRLLRFPDIGGGEDPLCAWPVAFALFLITFGSWFYSY